MNKPSSDLLEDLRSSLQDISKRTDANLTKHPDWGTINFTEAQQSINTVCAQAAELGAMPLDSLDEGQAQEIKRAIDRIMPIFEEMASFTIEGGGDPTARRDDIVSRFEQESQLFFSTYYQYIPYLNHRRGSHASDLKDIREATDQAKKLLESAKNHSVAARGELDKIISAARSAAPDAAIPSFASDFKEEADKWKKLARNWLFVTGAMYVLAVIVLGWLASAFTSSAASADTANLLYHLTIKLPFVAAFFVGAFWCSRHYSVCKQQVVVNRHRAHSIRTFKAFVAAAHDAIIKDAVLTKAVECVFVHVPTGLTRQESSQAQSQVLVDVGKALNRTVHSDAWTPE